MTLEETLACLGDDVPCRRFLREDLDRALRGSTTLVLVGDRLRWRPGQLHTATLRLSSQQILDFLRRQGGVSYGEAPNVLRLCVYLNREAEGFAAARRLIQPGWSVPYFDPPDEPFLALREDSLRALVLEDLAPTLWANGGWSTELQRQCADTPLLEELSTALALARGDRVAGLPPRLKKQGYFALQLFLDGQNEAAGAEWRKCLGRRKGGPALPGSAARPGTILRPGRLCLPGLVAVLARLAALRRNDLSTFLDPRLSAPSFPWLERFYHTLARHLLAPITGDQFVEQANLRACGCGLDALIWRAVEARLPPLPLSPPRLAHEGLLALPSLLDDRPLESGWKVWLDSLRQGLRSENAPPERGHHGGFLSWRLWSQGVMAYRHNDKDDPGRPVDLVKLARQPADYLTLQDRIVLGKMRGGSLTAGAARALAGHPHLYFEAAPCELVERPQKILVERTPEGLRVRLEPELKDGKEFRLERLDERKVALTVASPWSAVLQPLLAVPQAVPPEGEAELREILTGRPHGLAVECGPGVQPILPAVVRPDRIVLRILPRQSGLHLEWVARDDVMAFPALSGPARETIHWNGQDCRVERNFAQEQRWLEEIWDRCPRLPRETAVVLSELDSALELIEQLRAASIPLEWSQGKAWKVRGTITSSSLSLSSRRGEGEWFELTGSLRLDESKVLALSRALELARAYPGRYLPLQEGDFVHLDERLRQQLSELQLLLDGGPRVSWLAVPALEEITSGKLHTDEHHSQVLQRFAEATAWRAPIPRTLQVQLRDYQQVGFRWLAQRAKLGVGACLADDMGLGKTVQTLALMVSEQATGPHIVVCPTSVTGHWKDQIQRFCPTLEPKMYEGPRRRSLLEGLAEKQVLIVSYRVLLGDQKLLSAIDWNIALLDEAQSIKNPLSKTARATYSLPARVRLATTGTPIENRPSELWSLFRFLNPGLLGTLASFQRRFEQTFERDNRPHLRRLVAPFMLRRLKSEVLNELPPRTELTLTVNLSREERSLYESVRRRAQEEIEKGDTLQLLAHLTRLRQACCHPRLLVPDSEVGSAKLHAFLELLDHLRAGRHRALVFSQFTSLLDLVEEPLNARSIPYLRLDGSTPPSSRQSRVAAFQDGQGDLFLISLKAGGTGLNLTAADYVVHLDPWWNPAAEDQATDRVHRIGQTRPVTVYRILALDTIEEKVLRLHGHKRELARDILSGQHDQAPLGLAELKAMVQR